MADPGQTTIRLARPDDGAPCARIYAPAVADSVASFEAVAPSAGEMAARIARVTASLPWVVFEEGDVAGFAYASVHKEREAYRWAVDVSVYVDAPAQRRGVGRSLYQTLFALLRVQRFVIAHAGITLPNPASVGLHESLGFEPVGVYREVGYKFGRWHDVGWWQLRLAPSSSEPPEPVPLAVAMGLPDWEEAMAAGLQGWATG